MDPYYEQRLRDEVIYLHSLWHQGLPRNPNPVPVPPITQPHFSLQHCSSSPNPHGRRRKSSNPLQFSNPTPFKRVSSFSRNKNGMAGNDGSLTAAAEPSGGGAEWPVPVPKVDPSSGFSEWARHKPEASRTLPTAEEAAQLAVLQMQQRVSDSFRELLARTAGSDSEEAAEVDDDVAEDGSLEDTEEYKFFLDVFVRDRELRNYYEKNSASGDFCCFVCGGDRKQWKKKTKSCEGLLQHAMSIAKTNRRRAHRALGLVICKVFGWDVDRLPAILVKGEPLSRSLASSGDLEKCETTESSEVREKVSAADTSGLLQCKSKETLDVKKDDASAVALQNFQLDNVEVAGNDKTVSRVTDNSVKNVNINLENGERERDKLLTTDRRPMKFQFSGKLLQRSLLCQKSIENLEKGNQDMGVNKEELTDKMDDIPSGGEWPSRKVTTSPDSAVRKWPNWPSDFSNISVSAEEVARIAAEQRVLEACRDFFRHEYGPEFDCDEKDEDDGMTDEEGGEGGGEEGEGESEESKFFMKLFMEDSTLRNYYEKCYGDGDFLCLVCAGLGKKTWRRFKGCTGLLHHSNTIWKTKKKAHRAYARNVCKVLGWDINKLPQIVRISEPLTSSLVDSTIMPDSVPLCTSGSEWQREDIRDGTDPAQSEWSSLKIPSDLVGDSVSAGEKERLAAELNVLESCRDFFHCKYGPEYNEEEDQWDWMDEEEEEEEDEDEDELIDRESEEFNFFVKLFTENANLRSYYENSHGDGDFLCLVCGSVRKKAWRRFKGCIGLLQHSNTIWKVRKKAHRAYAGAVCKVLGWDMEGLPRIVSISKTLGQSLSNSASIQDSAPLLASGAEWPCEDIIDGPNAPASEWPSPKLSSESVSAEEKEKLAAEQKVLEACRNFFRGKYGPELDEDGDDEDEDELTDEEDIEADTGEDTMDRNPGNSEEFKFFVKLFTEDEKLRSFYENNHSSGGFCCLVCAAVDKKAWKRFKGCVGLLNHTNTVLETKIKAHRAYSRAVCRVLGWDIEQLPRIVCVSEPLSRSLAKSNAVQGEAKVKDHRSPSVSENPEPKENP
ncbi:hypothetical protein CDL15_Pgr007486 [Punica granatum]|uniref:Uncharacterized protein n=1 Tax=Punica granatum TaxID=22663 RepID=A0A218X9L1_PUNGR|nr:hypothetical protein CDL15_Pgr007486 [Punica granatum]